MKQYLDKLIITMEHPLPPPLAARVRSFFLIGLFCIITSGIFLFIGVLSAESLIAFLFPFLGGFLLFLQGIFFKWNAVTKGWEELQGVCVDHYNPAGFIPGRRGADAFIMNTQSGMIFVPTQKRSNPPPLDSPVTVYIEKNAQHIISQDGIIHYTFIYGYSIGRSQ